MAVITLNISFAQAVGRVDMETGGQQGRVGAEDTAHKQKHTQTVE